VSSSIARGMARRTESSHSPWTTLIKRPKQVGKFLTPWAVHLYLLRFHLLSRAVVPLAQLAWDEAREEPAGAGEDGDVCDTHDRCYGIKEKVMRTGMGMTMMSSGMMIGPVGKRRRKERELWDGREEGSFWVKRACISLFGGTMGLCGENNELRKAMVLWPLCWVKGWVDVKSNEVGLSL
jgi:hypothetical protein